MTDRSFERYRPLAEDANSVGFKLHPGLRDVDPLLRERYIAIGGRSWL